ncbi:MAG: 2Fe-2S iron-sulfur cluster binding domain-containing protein [Holosporaceae bacterium]|jgi:ferredoxin|nr:2Fe-2S iron-sulfur cluster binding domain-containing protein [Holosporaceae bacterium]
MKMTFILKNGNEKEASFSEKQTIFEVAAENGIHLGNCEGFGVCGACHLVVENLHDKLPPATEAEEDTLDRSSGLTVRSRLACQIILDASLDGLRVKIP